MFFSLVNVLAFNPSDKIAEIFHFLMSCWVKLKHVVIKNFVFPATDKSIGRFSYESKLIPIFKIIRIIANSRTVDVLVFWGVLQEMLMNGSTSNLRRSKPKAFVLVIVRNGVFPLSEKRQQILVLVEMFELVKVHATNIAVLAN